MSEHEHACEACGNGPDEEGLLEHGRGCYKVNDDGGGCEYIEEADISKRGGAALPTAPGLWLRGDSWAWVVKAYGGHLLADAWYIPSEKPTVYLGTRWDDLPRGDWKPANEAADLRAEVERLKRERGLLANGIASVAKAAGIIDGEQSLTGPQLLCLCEDMTGDGFQAQVDECHEREAQIATLTARAESAERERDALRELLKRAEWAVDFLSESSEQDAAVARDVHAALAAKGAADDA